MAVDLNNSPALREYRRAAAAFRPTTPPPLAVPAVFVACSESHRANALLASLEPAGVVQLPGGLTGPAGDRAGPCASALASIELAVARDGARHVVLCGHSGCRFVRGAGAAHGQEALRAHVRALLEDGSIGARARSGELALHALWFDEDEGDIFRYDAASRRFVLLGDAGVEAFVRELA